MLTKLTTSGGTEVCGACLRCGYPLYVGLTHQCVTALPLHVQEPFRTEKIAIYPLEVGRGLPRP